MRDDKVEVIIPQKRHEELLKKEEQLKEYVDNNSIFIGYKYLDLKHPMHILDEDRDTIVLQNFVGQDIPDVLKFFMKDKLKDFTEKVRRVEEHRLDKIEGAKMYLRDQIEQRYMQGHPPSWALVDWLKLKMENFLK